MPGRPIPFVTGEYYHVFNRGTHKQPIFWQKRDYQRFTQLMRFYQYENRPVRYSKFLLQANDARQTIWQTLLQQNQKSVQIIAYCLMPNHFHMLLKQETEQGISKFVGNIQNGYTRYANTKYNGSGHFLQGQFKAVHIEDDYQLLHVCRYIHLNPYTGFVVKTLDDLQRYQWSSFSEYLGQEQIYMCNKDIILDQFTNIQSYKSFVFDQAHYQRELDRIKHLLIEEES